MTDINQGFGSGGAAPGPDKGSPSKADGNVETAAAAGDIKQKLSDDVSSASEFARQELSGASEKAKEAVEGQKNFVAGKMSSVAAAIGRVAEELEQGDDRDLGKLARSVGTSMKTFSDDIQDRSLGEIAGMAEDFGRKQPLAFLGVAAIAGLAASRFLTASAAHGTSTARDTRANQNASAPASIGITPSGEASTSYVSSEGRTNG